MRRTAIDNTTGERTINFVEVEFRPKASAGSVQGSTAFLPSTTVHAPRATRKRAKGAVGNRHVESFDSQSALLDGHDIVPEWSKTARTLGSSKAFTGADRSDVV